MITVKGGDMITVKERADAQVLLDALERAVDKGDAVIDTSTLVSWAFTGRNANRAIDQTWLGAHVDPEGLHVAEAVLFHNDREFRVRVYAKVKEQMEPVVLWQDVIPADWERAREGTRKAAADLAAKIADAETKEEPGE